MNPVGPDTFRPPIFTTACSAAVSSAATPHLWPPEPGYSSRGLEKRWGFWRGWWRWRGEEGEVWRRCNTDPEKSWQPPPLKRQAVTAHNHTNIRLKHFTGKTHICFQKRRRTQTEAVVSKVSFIWSYERHKMQQHTRERVSRRKKTRASDSTDMLLFVPSRPSLLIYPSPFSSVLLCTMSHNNEQYEMVWKSVWKASFSGLYRCWRTQPCHINPLYRKCETER